MNSNAELPSRKQPLISIVIPVHKTSATTTANGRLDGTLASVYNQNYPNYEIIMVSDNVPLESYQDDIIKVMSEKTNYSELLNLGLHQTSGDFVCFLNPGDKLVYKYLTVIDKLLWRYPNLNWIASNYWKYNENTAELCNSLLIDKLYNYFTLFNYFERPFHSLSSICFRNRWMDTDKGRVHEIVFDPIYSSHTVADMVTKYALLYPEGYYNNDPMVYHYLTKENQSDDNGKSVMIPAVFELSDYVCIRDDKSVQKYLDLWSIRTCVENLNKKEFYSAGHNLDHVSDNYKCIKTLLMICSKMKIPIPTYLKNNF